MTGKDLTYNLSVLVVMAGLCLLMESFIPLVLCLVLKYDQEGNGPLSFNFGEDKKEELEKESGCKKCDMTPQEKKECKKCNPKIKDAGKKGSQSGSKKPPTTERVKKG